jgi:hypothetical protein
MAIGTATASKNIVLFTGGTLIANTRLTISDTAITPKVPIAGYSTTAMTAALAVALG